MTLHPPVWSTFQIHGRVCSLIVGDLFLAGEWFVLGECGAGGWEEQSFSAQPTSDTEPFVR